MFIAKNLKLKFESLQEDKSNLHQERKVIIKLTKN